MTPPALQPAQVRVFEAPVPYPEAVRLQESLVADRLADRIPDTVLFLEHCPVVTMGVRAKAGNILLSDGQLRRRGIELATTSRGGDVTWHGPGQLVIYPILKLTGAEADAHLHVERLEELAIRTAADFGVQAGRRPGLTGAWTAAGKLAAIGVRLKRWVSFHGMSFNVNPDLAGFDAIVPCGLAGETVTSLGRLLGGACPALAGVRARMMAHFGPLFGRRWVS